jgi:hypothetical protein
MESQDTYTVFEGNKLLCRGPLSEVILKVKRRTLKTDASFLIFSDVTGKEMDFNLQGTASAK